MAKRRRIIQKTAEAEEDTYEFVPPDFDEKEFILKDMYGTKVLIAVFILAIVAGIIDGVIQRIIMNSMGAGGQTVSVIIGLAIIIAGIVGMKKILLLLKYPEEAVDTKSMIGNYIMFALLTLGVWILCVSF